MPSIFRISVAVAALALAPIAVQAVRDPKLVTCLTIPEEIAPPGGFAQVKVFLTEPKPISTGDMAFSFGDFGDFAGIGLFSPGNDTLGVAVVRGSALTVSVVSSSATFGTDHKYPMLTVAGRVPAQAKVGTMIPIGILGEGLRLSDPSGAIYSMKELTSGSIVVAPGLSIDEVSPGSADLPAGSVVRITGQGFTPDTKVRFRHTEIAEVQYVDSANLDVVLASPTRMHGLEIDARNPGGSRTTFYSYQRTKRQDTSVNAILRDVVPLFSSQAVTAALVDIAAVPTGLALQNLESSPAVVNVELLAPDGQPLAATTLSLLPHRFVVKEISELFDIRYAPSLVVRVTSLTPIQVMGVTADPSGAVTPVGPRQPIADVPVVSPPDDPPAPTDVSVVGPADNQTELIPEVTQPETCLTIPDETAPPGGFAQVKVFLTEPKPISTGDMAFSFGDFGDFAGIGLFSPGNDTLGVAMVRGSAVAVSIVSSSGTFGTDHHYPMLTVSGRVRATAEVGTMIPIGILGDGLRLSDPSGAVYSMKKLQSGSVEVAPGVSIDEVSPGSADLPAGSVVRITGQGFTPGTKVHVRQTDLAEVRYIDSENLDVVLDSPTRMHGLRIEAENPDGSHTTYYSYQRTKRQDTSADAILRDVVPLFSSQAVTAALVDVAAVPTGLALQNLESSPAVVTLELLAPDGQPLAATTLTLSPHRFVVDEIWDLFDVPSARSMAIRVTSLTPIQVMGVTVDPSGAVTPVAPRQLTADGPVVSPSDNPSAAADLPIR